MALNSVDFPTFGRPTIPNFIFIFTHPEPLAFQRVPPFENVLYALVATGGMAWRNRRIVRQFVPMGILSVPLSAWFTNPAKSQPQHFNYITQTHCPQELDCWICCFFQFWYVVCFVCVRSLTHTNLRARKKNLFCMFYANACDVCGKGLVHLFVEYRAEIVWHGSRPFRQRYNADVLHVMPFHISPAVSVRSVWYCRFLQFFRNIFIRFFRIIACFFMERMI